MNCTRPPIFTDMNKAKLFLNKYNYVAISVLSQTKTKSYLNSLESYIIKKNISPGLLKNVGHIKLMNNIRKEPTIINAFQNI